MAMLTKINECDYPTLYGFMEQTWYNAYLGIVSKEHIEFLLHKYLDVPNILNYISEGYEYYYITEDVNVGLLVFVHRDNEVYLDKLYVLEEYRGKGYSTFALNELKKFGKDITLNVNRNNKNAIGVYKYNGFIIDKQVDLLLAGEFVNDDYVMRWKAGK